MLSQSVGYAASALGAIAGAGDGPMLVKDIAQACSIPPAYLAKIINALARKGIVATQRGIGGGVTLVRPPEQLTLMELCQAMDDPICQVRCFLGNAQCSDSRSCPAHHFWAANRAKVHDFLCKTTMADIAEFESHRSKGRGARPAKTRRRR
jgi:Rrf2 family protein